MRHLLQLLLQHFYSIRNCLSSSRQGKISINTVFYTPATSPEIQSCLIHIKCVLLADQQCRGLVLMITEPGPQPRSMGRHLKKETVLFQRHSEKIRVAISPGPFIREVSKAAQANYCKFFLQHWKDLRVQRDIAKWESSCETFQLWLEWRAIPPQSITWRFPKLAPAEHSLVVNDWSGQAWNSLNTSSQQGKA